MAKSGNDNLTANRLYQKARQMAYRRLTETHHEEFMGLLHECQHEIGAPHIHRCEEQAHAAQRDGQVAP